MPKFFFGLRVDNALEGVQERHLIIDGGQVDFENLALDQPDDVEGVHEDDRIRKRLQKLGFLIEVPFHVNHLKQQPSWTLLLDFVAERRDQICPFVL